MSAIESPLRVVIVPALFYDDHVDRDLPAGVEVKRNSRYVTVELTPTEWSELLSDARHYAAADLGPGYRGLKSSARATVKRLQEGA